MIEKASPNTTINFSNPDVTSTLISEDECFIGTWEQSPKFLQDNEYIKYGYRINFNTTKRVLKSLFMWHNETTNIWSHLLAAFLFIGFMIYISGWISFSESEETNLAMIHSNNSNQLTSFYGSSSDNLYSSKYFHIPELNSDNLNSDKLTK